MFTVELIDDIGRSTRIKIEGNNVKIITNTGHIVFNKENKELVEKIKKTIADIILVRSDLTTDVDEHLRELDRFDLCDDNLDDLLDNDT